MDMKIVNLLLAVMFLLFAFVQINDPDPLVWIAIYGVTAVLCVLAAFRIFKKWLSLALIVIFAIYAIFLFPSIQEWVAQDDMTILFDDLAKMQHLFVEESREFLGLLICIGALAMHLFQSRSLKAKA